tara:strand:- start:148 stop:450 length:303 start_codon:yes stop_codon:yes gene_type:complete
MNFLPIIIALILAPIILYFIYKSVDEDKDDIEERSFKMFSWVSDERFDLLYKLFSFEFIGFLLTVFYLVYYYINTGKFSLVLILIALLNLILAVIKFKRK